MSFKAYINENKSITLEQIQKERVKIYNELKSYSNIIAPESTRDYKRALELIKPQNVINDIKKEMLIEAKVGDFVTAVIKLAGILENQSKMGYFGKEEEKKIKTDFQNVSDAIAIFLTVVVYVDEKTIKKLEKAQKAPLKEARKKKEGMFKITADPSYKELRQFPKRYKRIAALDKRYKAISLFLYVTGGLVSLATKSPGGVVGAFMIDLANLLLHSLLASWEKFWVNENNKNQEIQDLNEDKVLNKALKKLISKRKFISSKIFEVTYGKREGLISQQKQKEKVLYK